MKKFMFISVLLGVSSVSFAYDANYVHKFSCSGGVFYGLPLNDGMPVSYIPVDVNGPYCKVYPNTRLTAGSNNSCMGLQVQKTGLLAAQCAKGN